MGTVFAPLAKLLTRNRRGCHCRDTRPARPHPGLDLAAEPAVRDPDDQARPGRHRLAAVEARVARHAAP